MSHTTTINDTDFVHDGDYDGTVKIIRNGVVFEIPFDTLRGFVACYVRDRTIARVEQTSDIGILFNGKGN